MSLYLLRSSSLSSVTEDQGNTSPLGHTSSSLSKKHFKGDLTEVKGAESNIQAKGPEWVATNFLRMKDRDQDVKEDPASPDLTLALGTLVFDPMPVSKIRLVNIAE